MVAALAATLANAVLASPDPLVGQRMYREGLGAAGEPLTATVSTDVPLLGTQASCEGCHGRSGLGAAEGSAVVPPIAGPLLFAAARQPQRPAYDATSLGRALRDGITPAGRKLSALMPRYRLGDGELADLTAYLGTLSVVPSPGVDAVTIRFATVVTDAVPVPQREGVLAVLREYVEEKNRQTRLESRRPAHGPTPESKLPSAFREWALDVWTLTGPSETWDRQLEEHYRRAPVFAMLGGLVAGSWSPVGRFCERRALPCLFPSTDSPDAAAGNFYTLFFSRGLELEAKLIARHIRASAAPAVVQVYCDDTAAAARELRTAVAPEVAVEDLTFSCAGTLPVSALAARLLVVPGAAAVLWVRREHLVDLDAPLPGGPLYVSGALLERDLANAALAGAPGPVWAAQAFRPPRERDPGLTRFVAWASTRGIAIRDSRRQAEAFFACLAVNDAIAHIHRYFVRDFVLDMLDHGQSLSAYVPLYARPTFGPDQRYLAKGGYVLRIAGTGADEPEWRVP